MAQELVGDDAALVDGLIHVFLCDMVGMHPDGCSIHCLSCGGETPYSTEACRACGAVLGARRPFVHGNHLTQLLDAIDGFREGTLERTVLVGRRDVYLAFLTPVLQAFDLTSIPILGRLDDPALDEASETLDVVLDLLGGALGRLQAVCNPSARPASLAEAALLERVSNDLIEFGRGACAACAELMAWRENVPTATSLPSMLDIPLA